MLQGALIGLVVGLVMLVVRSLKNNKGGKTIVAAMDSGSPQAAADAVNAYVKPPGAKISANAVLNMLERFAWLAVIGELETLEREIEGLNGPKGVVSQLQLQGYAGLLAHRTEASDLQKLEAAANTILAEDGMMMKLVRGLAEVHLGVARGLQQVAIDPDHLKKLNARSQQLGPGSTIMLQRFIARAVEASGGDPRQHQVVIDNVFARFRNTPISTD